MPPVIAAAAVFAEIGAPAFGSLDLLAMGSASTWGFMGPGFVAASGGLGLVGTLAVNAAVADGACISVAELTRGRL